jgi:hypothetical protein
MELGDDGVRRQRIEGGWMVDAVGCGVEREFFVPSCRQLLFSNNFRQGVAELAGERGREVGCS